MKVKELMRRLSEFPEDMEVGIVDSTYEEFDLSIVLKRFECKVDENDIGLHEPVLNLKGLKEGVDYQNIVVIQ